MGCNCGGNKAVPGQPWRGAPPAFPKPAAVKPAPTTPRPKQFNQEGFCPTCGWLLKQITVYDPRTGVMVKRNVCTNSRCGSSR